MSDLTRGKERYASSVRHVPLRSLLLCLLLGAAGCTYAFDGTAPDLPTYGQPLDLSGLPRWNKGIAEDLGVLTGVDGADWVYLREQGGTVRLHRLTPPVRDESIEPMMLPGATPNMAPQVGVGLHTLFVIQQGPSATDPTMLTIRRIGAEGPGQVLMMPPGQPQLYVGGDDSVLLYAVFTGDAPEMLLMRLDGPFSRKLPLPAGVDPAHAGDNQDLLFYFDLSGDHLLLRDGNGELFAYSTRTDDQADLANLSRATLFLDPNSPAVIAGTRQGVLRVTYAPPARPLTLDPAPYLPGSGFHVLDSAVFYVSGVAQDDPAGHTIHQVPIDGSGPPRVLLTGPAQQLIRVLPSGDVLYSRDPVQRFVNNASDGWLGSWRFMQRGRALTLSGDQQRLRFLEDAAQIGGAGQLESVPIGSNTPLMLLRNAHSYSEIDDGRILAVDDYAFRGPQNRLVLVDERARAIQVVAESVMGFTLLPGTTDVLLRVVTGLQGFDVVRVPLPPPLPPVFSMPQLRQVTGGRRFAGPSRLNALVLSPIIR